MSTPQSVLDWQAAEGRAADAARACAVIIDAGQPVPLQQVNELARLRAEATALLHSMVSDVKTLTA